MQRKETNILKKIVRQIGFNYKIIPGFTVKKLELRHGKNSFIHLFIHSVLRQVHNLFQSDFSTEVYPVHPVSISSISSFP